MTRHKIWATAIFVVSTFFRVFGDSSDTGVVPVSACVLPLAVSNIAAGDAQMITDALRMKLSAKENILVLDREKSAQAWLITRHSADSGCIGEDCIYAAGRRAAVRYAISGSIGRIGNLFSLSATIYEVKARKRIFMREYEYTGAIEEFYADVPRRVADDIAAKLSTAPLTIRQAPLPETTVTQEAPVEKPVVKTEPVETNIGIVRAPAIGASGRVALGAISATQSRWGGMLFFLYPTSKRSHLRVKIGLPLSGSDSMYRDYGRFFPDQYGSIEHEWGMARFGAGVGIAVMRMQAFTKNYYYPYTLYDQNGMMLDPGNYPVNFKESYGLNWVVTLRGGKPNAGFMGRISWPMPISKESQNLQNAFFEYSALGVFGGSRIKGGLGLQGMMKNRMASAEYSTDVYYYSNTAYSVDDSYTLAPCGKFAMLIGKRSVLCAGIDLGGIFIPRPSDQSWWAPNVQIDYTFSFKPLHGPTVLDGTF